MNLNPVPNPASSTSPVARPFENSYLSFSRRDDGSLAFYDDLVLTAKKILDIEPPHRWEFALNDLAERTEAQRVTSYKLEQLLIEHSKSTESHPIFRNTRGLLITLASDTPPTVGSAADKFYRSFVAAPFDRQVAFLQQQLDFKSDQFNNFAPNILSALMYGFLPPDCREPDRPTDKPTAAEIGRYMIKPFCKVATAEQKIEFITALLAVHRNRSQLPTELTPHTRFGYQLGSFLSSLGPGMQKTGQYAHSLPMTPEEWLEGLASLKTNDGHMLRWNVWHKIDQQPDKIGLHIKLLGTRRGSGAYQTTYDVKFDSEFQQRIIASHPEKYKLSTPLVLKLMKPGAGAHALSTIDLVIRLCDDIVAADPKAAASALPIQKLLRHARRMVEPETDLRFAKIQEEIAFRSYKRFTIIVDNEEFPVRPTAIFAQSAEYQVAELTEGRSLNALARLNDPRVVNYAAAILLSQLLNKGSGRESDHDCHGDNVSCEQGMVKHFDYGGMELLPPTPSSRHFMAHLIFNTAQNSRRNGYPFLSSLKHTMGEMESHGLHGELAPRSDFEFLESTQRCLISWSDCYRNLGAGDSALQKANLKAVLKAFVATGEADWQIIAPLLRRFISANYIEFAQRSRWLPKFHGILKNEYFQRSHYYPDNPNPHQKPKEKRPPISSLSAPVTPLKIEVIMHEKSPLLKRILFGAISRFL